MASATDDFNRADGGLGANWTDSVSGIVVNSNRAYQGTFTTHAVSFYTGTVWTNDHSSQILVTDGSKFHGVGVRVTATEGYFFLGGSGSNAALFERLGGTYNEIASFACTFTAGDVIYIEVNGTTVTLKQNGVTMYSTTRTGVPSGGSPGIHMYDGTATLDDWAGADIASGGGGAGAASPLSVLGAG